AGDETALELDHRATRRGYLAGDDDRAPLRQMEGSVLLPILVLACRTVDRKNDVVTALRGARSRADGRPLEGVAADDDALRARLLEDGIECGPEEFVGPALPIPFAGTRLDGGIHDIVRRRLTLRSDQAVPDDHVLGAGAIV